MSALIIVIIIIIIYFYYYFPLQWEKTQLTHVPCVPHRGSSSLLLGFTSGGGAVRCPCIKTICHAGANSGGFRVYGGAKGWIGHGRVTAETTMEWNGQSGNWNRYNIHSRARPFRCLYTRTPLFLHSPRLLALEPIDYEHYITYCCVRVRICIRATRFVLTHVRATVPLGARAHPLRLRTYKEDAADRARG